MAQPGEELKNASSGQTLVFRKTSAETGGELLEVESIWAPGGAEPVEHFHPRQQERFEVTAGVLGVRIAGAERELRAGDVLEVPARTVHAMWNGSEHEPARAIWQTRPALGTERFFETVWGLAREGKLGRGGSPNPLQGAVLMREFRNEFRLAHPPAPVQSALFALLAPIGRLLGYRARAGNGG